MTQEPFGYFNNPYLDGWQSCAETDEGAIPLYEAPPAAQINQRLVEALQALLAAVQKCHCENSGAAQEMAHAALQAARGE